MQFTVSQHLTALTQGIIMPAKTIYQAYTYFIKWSIHDMNYYGVRYTRELYHRSPEEDLWIEYFSSSPYVKEFREENGEPNIIQIRRKFDNPENAISWEHKVLTRLNAANSPKWLNRSNGGSVLIMTEETRKKISNAMKGNLVGEKNPMYGRVGEFHPMYDKTWEEIHGEEKAQEMKQALAARHNDKTWENIYGEEESRRMKNLISGENHYAYNLTPEEHPNYGSKRDKSAKQKMSEFRKGKSYEELYGENTAQELKKNKSESSKGEQNIKFEGYFITPWGTFITINDAKDVSPVSFNRETISKYCKNNQKKISRQSISHSDYLTDNMFGKTFEEIGFGFEPK